MCTRIAARLSRADSGCHGKGRCNRKRIRVKMRSFGYPAVSLDDSTHSACHGLRCSLCDSSISARLRSDVRLFNQPANRSSERMFPEPARGSEAARLLAGTPRSCCVYSSTLDTTKPGHTEHVLPDFNTNLRFRARSYGKDDDCTAQNDGSIVIPHVRKTVVRIARCAP